MGCVMDLHVETEQIDRRYERCRLRSAAREQRLLAQIAEAGIKEALLGTAIEGRHVLLDGFKRLRCARRLSLPSVPFRSLGADEATAIIALMRLASSRTLSFVEEAWLIDELRSKHKLQVVEIARRLDRSTAWVSVRLGVTAELTPAIAEKIASGAFPMHAYLASIRPITRVTPTQPREIEDFVRATSGKGLSVREIDVLAKGYFTGSADFRRHVMEGDVRWCLAALGAAAPRVSREDGEGKVLQDLELVARRVRRLPAALAGVTAGSARFLAEGHVLSGSLLRLLPSFTQAIRGFHDRCGSTEGGRLSPHEGDGQAGDCAGARAEPQHGA